MAYTLRVNYICFVKEASKITWETDMITAGYINLWERTKSKKLAAQ